MLRKLLLDLTTEAELGPNEVTKGALAARSIAVSHTSNSQACLFRLDSSLTAQGLPDDQAP